MPNGLIANVFQPELYTGILQAITKIFQEEVNSKLILIC